MEALKVQLKALEILQPDLEKGLVALMGDYKAAEHSGVRVNCFQMQGPIDYKTAIQTLLPDVLGNRTGKLSQKNQRTRAYYCRDEAGKLAEVPFNAEVLKDLVGFDYWF